MSNFNKIILMGNLVRDPELSQTNSGVPVCNFTIANNRRYRSGEEWVSEPTFVDVTIFGAQATSFSERHSKGQPAFVEGHLRQDRWEDENGQKRTKLYVVADNWTRLPQRETLNSAEEEVINAY